MASKETQILDNIISSRRALLVGGGAAMAALAMPTMAKAANTVTSFSDNDILNFALNLEYLEANFYYLAAFGTNISTANTLYPTGSMVQGITGTGKQGTVVVKPNPKVPFANLAIASYAVETAVEEGKHVAFLRSALGPAAVAQPDIDLMTSWNTLATSAGIASTFDPFASDANFLIGAYVFEDVGVTAYKGAASLFTTGTTGKTLLAAALGILAVEAYHAGLIRTTINALDDGSLGVPAGTLTTYTNQISTVRAMLSRAALSTAANPDDFGLLPGTAKLPILVPVPPSTTPTADSTVTVPRTSIVDADSNAVVFSRNTSQVLNIVTGGAPLTTVPGTTSKGLFFTSGLNGLFS